MPNKSWYIANSANRCYWKQRPDCNGYNLVLGVWFRFHTKSNPTTQAYLSSYLWIVSETLSQFGTVENMVNVTKVKHLNKDIMYSFKNFDSDDSFL